MQSGYVPTDLLQEPFLAVIAGVSLSEDRVVRG